MNLKYFMILLFKIPVYRMCGCLSMDFYSILPLSFLSEHWLQLNGSKFSLRQKPIFRQFSTKQSGEIQSPFGRWFLTQINQILSFSRPSVSNFVERKKTNLSQQNIIIRVSVGTADKELVLINFN